MKLSIQTYTVQNHIETDLWGTLKKLSSLGLRYVEIGGTFGLPAKELKAGLDDLGLAVSGMHTWLGNLEKEFDKIVDDNRTLGNKYIVLASVDRALHSQGWTTVAKTLEPMGAKLRDAGFIMAYHNHNFEFALENGKPGLDVLYESSDSALVKAQIDAYWVLYGGGDPGAYIRKLKGRVPLVHLKDGVKGGAEPHFLEVGQGDVDWDDVLAACKECDVEFGAIEQDSSDRDSMESARMSVEFLRARGFTE